MGNVSSVIQNLLYICKILRRCVHAEDETIIKVSGSLRIKVELDCNQQFLIS
ncbi:hypothetical protein OBV_05100 [Oscillibacter valericigenes Sjm18-20]|nr:hypothetical protein OBV_05100 [Oscillibacter valericigenes Sjm18-20]